MQKNRKEAALNRFKPLVAETTREQMLVMIAKDNKNFDGDEAEELINELYPPAEHQNPPEEPEKDQQNHQQGDGPNLKEEETPQIKVADRRGELIDFDLYHVVAVTKKMLIEGAVKDAIIGYKKKGEKIKSSRIQQVHADRLNAQVRQSFQYYFKSTDPEMIDLETVLNL